MTGDFRHLSGQRRAIIDNELIRYAEVKLLRLFRKSVKLHRRGFALLPEFLKSLGSDENPSASRACCSCEVPAVLRDPVFDFANALSDWFLRVLAHR